LVHATLDWVVRLKGGAPMQADLNAFLRWRQQGDEREEALRAAIQLY
jgi:transmembrane sensor